MDRRTARFMKYVEPCPTTGCWLWTGCISSAKMGYGLFWWGKERLPYATVGAHRAAYWLFIGYAENCQIMHLCDVPLCVNPAHLICGDAILNKMDQMRKHRHAYGTRQWQAKLTDELVREIRFSDGVLSNLHWANRLGVSQSLISQVRLDKIWRHVK